MTRLSFFNSETGFGNPNFGTIFMAQLVIFGCHLKFELFREPRLKGRVALKKKSRFIGFPGGLEVADHFSIEDLGVIGSIIDRYWASKLRMR